MSVKAYVQEGFATHADVSHGFFTRLGGVSAGVYESLNMGFGSDDAQENVWENRRRVGDVLGVGVKSVLTVYQEHGATCLSVTQAHDALNAPKADAMVTDQAGFALGVLTADCAPVLFYGVGEGGKPVIGAAHAGWRGALGSMLASTVAQMEALGAQRRSIQACIGPCIGKVSYEVSADFVEPFMAEDAENDRFFGAGAKEGHPLFDLAGYCAFKLSRIGLSQIFIQDMDTYALEGEFFSYRRAAHRGEVDYGRQISAIVIK